MSKFPFALLLSLLLIACAAEPEPRIALDAEGQAAAEAALYPAFRAIQVDTGEPPAELAPLIEGVLAPLRAAVLDGESVQVWLTGEADADAGCLAGGRLFLTRGMLSWIEDRQELAGALAVALGQCPRARAAWQRRADSVLAPVESAHALLLRYRDYRLPDNAAVFEQLTLRGCGSTDCLAAGRALLTGAGQPADGLDRLAARLQASWPDAAWLDRLGGGALAAEAIDASAETVGRMDDGDLREALAAHRERREGLGQLAAVKRAMYAGDLGEAYRQVLLARRALDNEFEAELVFAELSLLNFHPDSAERSLERLAATGRTPPQSDYLWGVQKSQSRARVAGERHLRASLDQLPRISAHFHLGILLHRAGELDAALEHYRVVAEAEPGHPQSAPATSYIAQIEGS